MSAADAVVRDRVHYESGVVEAEPGVDQEALDSLERAGTKVRRWSEPNLFFGGVQAVARAPDGELSGGGDPRRGGVAVVVAD